MRILVTGGAGFIGSHLVDAYLAAGHTVAIADNFSTGLAANVNPQARLYEIDLVDRAAVAAMIEDFRPELLSHHAGHLSVYQSVADPWHDAEVNLIGFLNLIEPAIKCGLQRIVTASSGGVVYGDDVPRPTPETVTPQPVSPYGVTKLALEAYLHYYGVQYQLPWVALRYANVYGPRQNPRGETGVISVFLEQMAAGKQPVINGDGEQTRDYVSIDDVVRANLTLVQRGSGIYNLGTGVGTSVIEIFQLLQAALGTTFPQQHGPARRGEQRQSVLDSTRAANELGWQPTVALQAGIQRTVDWYRTTQLQATLSEVTLA